MIKEADRVEVLSLIAEAIKNGARKSLSCKTLKISIRTFQRWSKPGGVIDKRKSNNKSPANKLSLEEENLLFDTINDPGFCDLTPPLIVAQLADAEIYLASERTIYRRLRQRGQLSHRGQTNPKTYKKPKECVATGPNQVWSWDITHLKSTFAGQPFFLYLVMDLFSRMIAGWCVKETESTTHSSQLIEELCRLHHIQENQLTLHSDNGHPMRGSTMIETLTKLKVKISRNRPGVCSDNAYSESLFKTTKHNSRVICPKQFDKIEDVYQWMIAFVDWYNNKHLHSGISYVTPYDRHHGYDKAILLNRHHVYEKARIRNPERWTGNVKAWACYDKVILNRDHKLSDEDRMAMIRDR